MTKDSQDWQDIHTDERDSEIVNSNDSWELKLFQKMTVEADNEIVKKSKWKKIFSVNLRKFYKCTV